MQSQLKTVQPQSKTLRKKGKIQLEPERLLFIASANSNFQLQMQEPARGYPLWTCSLQFLKRNLIKKTFLNNERWHPSVATLPMFFLCETPEPHTIDGSKFLSNQLNVTGT